MTIEGRLGRGLSWVALLALVSAAACGADAPPEGAGTGSTAGSTNPDGHGGTPSPAADGKSVGAGGDDGASSPARSVASRLGLPPRFAIGTGNDANGEDPSQALGLMLEPKIDIHYSYLSQFEWPSWGSSKGQYVTDQANAARAHGTVPMFTLYQAPGAGEGDFGAFSDGDYMKTYWDGVRLLFQRLGDFGAPAIVHLEPDIWGSAQQVGGDDPASVHVKVGSAVPECSDLPEDVSGMARCEIRLARSLAPKVVVGLSASTFAAFDDDGNSDPARIGKYLKAIGAAEADIMVVETLDRDAGCFESGDDPNCQRSDGVYYWDETNETHPNFHDHLAWAKTIHDVVGRPLLWWQMPLGVPSDSPGWKGHYRDNRVKYLFSHVDEFVAAGGFGAVFGPGADNQTTLETDDGQFASALTKFLGSPTSLP